LSVACSRLRNAYSLNIGHVVPAASTSAKMAPCTVFFPSGELSGDDAIIPRLPASLAARISA
jgi:hypothetical protein